MGAKPETIAKLKSYIDQGPKASWTWEKALQEIITLEGLEVGERGKEVAEHAASAIRGYYPNREKSWEETFKNAAPEAVNLEFEHIVELAKFEIDFTLKNRPEPPKKEKKAKGEGAPVPPPPPPADGGAPAAPPAPPAPPPPPQS